MFLSMSKKFIFIHVPKTGGVSIQRALQGFGSAETSNLFRRHVTAREARAVIDMETWGQCFTFGFVRNPWDYQVSMYSYVLNSGPAHPEYQNIRRLGNFSNYIEQHVQTLDREGSLRRQTDFLYDGDVKIVDLVGRFERLEQDFNRVCQILDLGHLNLCHCNQSRRGDYQDYYNAATKALVAKIFCRDIEAFSYRF